jgi:hypothetical protein
MSLPAILLPLFVEVILTFVLMLQMGALRSGDFRSGAVRREQIALREPNWPARTAQAANSYANQFELPVLFYVLTILALVTRHADLIFVLLAWLFVIFRVLQAYVHVTSNVVRLRGSFFAVSALVLMIMWAIFIIEVLTGIIL